MIVMKSNHFLLKLIIDSFEGALKGVALYAMGQMNNNK